MPIYVTSGTELWQLCLEFAVCIGVVACMVGAGFGLFAAMGGMRKGRK